MPRRKYGVRGYFTEYTLKKGLFYAIVIIYVLAVCVAVVIETFMTHECDASGSTDLQYQNVLYKDNPCRHQRMAKLIFLTPAECSFGRRLVFSVIFGGIIGWERREADRPAGIRTMALVSLGSCLFTINSAFAFLDGPMSWDASRISAAIPSGVGFLGAGLIFKEAEKDKVTGESSHVVHGLTTAASLWLSAAVGVACGGGLYFSASFCVALMLLLLRFGPRTQSFDDDSEEEDDDEIETEFGTYSSPMKGPSSADEQTALVRKNSERRESVRKRPLLGDVV